MICAGADATSACPDSPENGSFLLGTVTQFCTGVVSRGVAHVPYLGMSLYDVCLLPGDEKGEQVFFME